MASSFAVTIRSSAGDGIHLRVSPSDTVWNLKELLSMEIGRPPGCMQLIHREEILQDDSKSLVDLCVADGADLSLVFLAFPMGTFLLHDPTLHDKDEMGCDATLVHAIFWNDGTFQIQIQEEGLEFYDACMPDSFMWEQDYSGRTSRGQDYQLFLSVSRCEQRAGHSRREFDCKPKQLLGEYGQNEDEIRLKIPYATLFPYPNLGCGLIEERWDTLQRISAEPVSLDELQGQSKQCAGYCCKHYHIACMRVADKPSECKCNVELYICQACFLRDYPATCGPCSDMDDGMVETSSKGDDTRAGKMVTSGDRCIVNEDELPSVALQPQAASIGSSVKVVKPLRADDVSEICLLVGCLGNIDQIEDGWWLVNFENLEQAHWISPENTKNLQIEDLNLSA